MPLISDFITMSLLDRDAKLIDDRDSPAGTDYFTRITSSDDNEVERYFVGLGANNVANALDTALQNGELPDEWNAFIARLQQHYSEIGGTGYGTLKDTVATRKFRLHRKVASLLPTYNFPSSSLFDDEVSLGTFAYGGSFSAGSDLNSAVQAAKCAIEVGTGGIGGSDWVLSVLAVLIGPSTTLSGSVSGSATEIAVADAAKFPSLGTIQVESEQITYTGKTSTSFTGCTRGANGTSAASHASGAAVFPVATESVTCAASAPEGTQYPVGGLPVTSFSKQGQKDLNMSDTTGYYAGQKVLVIDNQYPTALTAPAASGQPVIYVSDASPFSPGDSVTIREGATSEAKTILSVDYETEKVTLNSQLSNSYTPSAFLYKTTGSGNGWNETHEIDSVTANSKITLKDNLLHSHYTSAIVHRLYSDITGLSTSSGGSAGDDVIAKAPPDRTIAL